MAAVSESRAASSATGSTQHHGTGSGSSASSVGSGIRYLNQKESQQIDELLMSREYGFSIDQLMELAGLSCAQAIEDAYPPSSKRRVLIVCGPGNNGGDGLVCARHLVHFGYSVAVVYPKEAKQALYQNLLQQCRTLSVPIHSTLPERFASEFDIVVDAIFGFSFDASSGIRAPFDQILSALRSISVGAAGSPQPTTGGSAQAPAIVSIDIPSGSDVERGDVHSLSLYPSLLISLTAPKLCARHFSKSTHYLGGRFVPPALAEKFALHLPNYEGGNQFFRLSAPAEGTGAKL
jgi:NAD(P)H-hydrate epimerase